LNHVSGCQWPISPKVNAHAICENCKVVVVEVGESSYSTLASAERSLDFARFSEAEHTAVDVVGATEVSNSWGFPELTEAEEKEAIGHTGAFDYPGTVITAAA